MLKALLIAAFAISALALTDEEQWAAFKLTYKKTYAMDAESYRFSVFQQNLRKAEALQAQSTTATFGVTMFSDLTSAEFRKYYANLDVSQVAAHQATLPAFNPAGITAVGTDWVAKGLVSRVKDQGQCGSCWAFSATAAAEGCYALRNGKTIDLAAEYVKECCTEGGSDSCEGGWPNKCLSWAMSHDLYTWDSYNKYVEYDVACKIPSTAVVGLKAGTCTEHDIPANNEADTVKALTMNVVSICLDATPLQSYRSGVLSGSSCNYKNVDHAVLLVSDEGAGTSYVVKNSWGTSWGESGYFRMAKNVNCLNLTQYDSVAY